MGILFCLRQLRSGLCRGYLFQLCNLKLLFRMWCLSINWLARCVCKWRIACRCLLIVLAFLARVFTVHLNMQSHITYNILGFSWLFCIPLDLLFLRLKLCSSFRLGISVQLVFLGTCLVAFYQRMQTWIIGLQCGFWFCVKARRLAMALLLAVLIALLVLLNVGVVPPLEVYQSCLLVQHRSVISGLVSQLEVVRDFLWRWAPLEVSRGEQVV